MALAAIFAFWNWLDTLQDTAMEGDSGMYAYTCENGSAFTMEPAADAQSIELSAGSQAIFTGNVTLTNVGGTRFEGANMGMGIVFVGAGEEVQFSVDNEETVCNPVPNESSPPWNWVDPGEGGGSLQPDTRLVVGESIMGEWKSLDDAKFVREFRNFNEGEMMGEVVDTHDGEEVASGTYEVYTKERPAPMTGIPLEDNTVYIRIIAVGTQTDALNFKVNKLTPEELELTYMDRGGVLRFEAVR